MSNIAIFAGIMLALACSASAVMIDGKQMSIDDAIIKAGSNGAMSKMYEIMQDTDMTGNEIVMIDLDMIYKMETYNEMVKDMVPVNMTDKDGKVKRKAIRAASYRWTNQRIPYEISYTFSSNDRALIGQAIADYHRYTCLRFTPATSSDRNRVRFQNGGGCSSYVGMIGNTQPISLAPGCRYKGIIIHEMGHAIGFQHEQTRPDRDTYVYINTANIQQGVAYNFMRYSSAQVNNYGVPYDYTSVMHYSGTAFTRNGQPTIVARDSRFQNSMGNRDGFSFKDIQLANTMYNCASVNRCAQRTCPQGFQGPDCQCWCDSGNRRNPVKVCDGTGPVVATTTTTTPGPTRPMTCEDSNQYCPRWASAGFCTGQYATYMRMNCQYSCNTCEQATTTTTAMPTPPVANCEDENRYCSYWANRGECTRNPSYMNANCKRSCNACEGGSSDCKDMNDNCPRWTDYCNDDTYRSYLSKNCMKSCGICTAQDEQATTTSAPLTKKPLNKCMNRWEDSKCEKKASGCSRFRHVIYNCKKTCGLC